MFICLSYLQELQAEVAASCQYLCIPAPHPVSVLLGSLAPPGEGNVFRALVEAAVRPERHIPDTPVKKVTGIAGCTQQYVTVVKMIMMVAKLILMVAIT